MYSHVFLTHSLRMLPLLLLLVAVRPTRSAPPAAEAGLAQVLLLLLVLLLLPLLLLLLGCLCRQECSSKLLKLDWLKGKSPLPGGETAYTGGGC
jgi:hypothetical protein